MTQQFHTVTGLTLAVLEDDLKLFNPCIDQIIDGKINLLFFTSAPQVHHLLDQASQRDLELTLRRALHPVGIIAMGPACAEALTAAQLFPDLEVHPDKIENLIEKITAPATEIVKKKQQRAARCWVRGNDSVGAGSPRPQLVGGETPPLQKTNPDHVPIWLMRQAGRYMAEYQLQRQGLSFLQFCKKPSICAEAAITAVERLGVDAAILFSDILVVCEPLGLKLDFKEQQGPWIENPIHSPEAVTKLRTPNITSDLGYVFEAISLTRKNLQAHIPLIGFCGAPFTLAAYMIEGKGSRDYKLTKQFMFNHPEAWHELMQKISTLLIEYLNLQIASGCQMIQMFDSWAGCLNVQYYATYVLPHVQKIFAALPPSIPSIIFAAHAGHLLNSFAKSGANIISLDDRVDITQLPSTLSGLGIQGNLDPILLFSKPKIFLPQVKFILDNLAKRPGYIFNLGHGILPETPVDHVMALVDFVHTYRV